MYKLKFCSPGSPWRIFLKIFSLVSLLEYPHHLLNGQTFLISTFCWFILYPIYDFFAASPLKRMRLFRWFPPIYINYFQCILKQTLKKLNGKNRCSVGEKRWKIFLFLYIFLETAGGVGCLNQTFFNLP